MTWVHEMARDDWSVRTETRTRLTCDSTHYYIDASLRAWAGETLEREHDWSVSVPRLHS